MRKHRMECFALIFLKTQVFKGGQWGADLTEVTYECRPPLFRIVVLMLGLCIHVCSQKLCLPRLVGEVSISMNYCTYIRICARLQMCMDYMCMTEFKHLRYNVYGLHVYDRVQAPAVQCVIISVITCVWCSIS
jgi:hypothetical protein